LKIKWEPTRIEIKRVKMESDNFKMVRPTHGTNAPEIVGNEHNTSAPRAKLVKKSCRRGRRTPEAAKDSDTLRPATDKQKNAVS